MAPPMRTRSQRSSRLSDERQLVGHLRAAEDRHERVRRVAQQALQHLDLALQQQPGAGGEPARDPLGGGVGAVGGAERVVDVVRVALREPVGEGRVVLLLLRVEAEVLQHHQLAGAERRHPAADLVAHAVGQQLDPPAHQLAQPGGGRSERQLRLRSPFGLPRCEQTATPAPASSRYSSVGTEARMRASSVTRPSSSGTFRSARTSTRAPDQSTPGRRPRGGGSPARA